MTDDKIIIKHYKCFGNEGGEINGIKLINIIIGKNNSGKSSLIDVIKYLATGGSDIKPTSSIRDGKATEVLIEHIVSKDEMKLAFNDSQGYSGGPIKHLPIGNNYVGSKYTYKIDYESKQHFVKTEKDFDPSISSNIRKLAEIIKRPLFEFEFRHVLAERDIKPEPSNPKDKIPDPNGDGTTSLIQFLLSYEDQRYNLVEVDLLNALNSVLNPDIIIKKIIVKNKFSKSNTENRWEIQLEDINRIRVPLSKMGSGIKTILLVLTQLVVGTVITGKPKNKFVFAFEELENNLHPALQRRLYKFIRDYANENGSTFYITTHSNIVIDTFSNDKDAQIIHVTNNGNESKTSIVSSTINLKNILVDLHIKSSDLLQANAIIWVEGPSDRNYINKWISLIDSNLIEGLHYSIMFYGGRLLSRLSFDIENFDRQIIPLLKINTNAYVIMDSDISVDKNKINNTKKRIASEIGEGKHWITQGREIENYLHNDVIKSWLEKNHNFSTDFNGSFQKKFENSIKKVIPDGSLKYEKQKTKYSEEIATHITIESLSYLDLKIKVDELVENIKQWNHI